MSRKCCGNCNKKFRVPQNEDDIKSHSKKKAPNSQNIVFCENHFPPHYEKNISGIESPKNQPSAFLNVPSSLIPTSPAKTCEIKS